MEMVNKSLEDVLFRQGTSKKLVLLALLHDNTSSYAIKLITINYVGNSFIQ